MSPSGLSITWSDGHKSFYTPSFLARYASPAALSSFHKDIAQTPWALNDTASGKMPDLFLPYASISTDAGLMRAITQLAQYGLLFVQGVPNEETDNATCELRTLGERFGELRRTFYGETWDVVNLKDSKNIAYTNLDLGMHMDLLCVQSNSRQISADFPVDTFGIHLAIRFSIVCVTAWKAVHHFSSMPSMLLQPCARLTPTNSISLALLP